MYNLNYTPQDLSLVLNVALQGGGPESLHRTNIFLKLLAQIHLKQELDLNRVKVTSAADGHRLTDLKVSPQLHYSNYNRQWTLALETSELPTGEVMDLFIGAKHRRPISEIVLVGSGPAPEVEAATEGERQTLGRSRVSSGYPEHHITAYGLNLIQTIIKELNSMVGKAARLNLKAHPFEVGDTIYQKGHTLFQVSREATVVEVFSPRKDDRQCVVDMTVRWTLGGVATVCSEQFWTAEEDFSADPNEEPRSYREPLNPLFADILELVHDHSKYPQR